VKYLAFRRKVRNPVVQFIFRNLPLSVRKKIFGKVKSGSKASKQEKSAMIMDVTDAAVKEVMCKYQVNHLIHGHTHRPAIHAATNEHGERIVLGDWCALGWYLIIDGTDKKLLSFSTAELST
jgi:UDP-2,3-diacylglucosamine hydrolase